jgi:hypothetical protein
MKILIAGDSFAASWPNTTNGWMDLLAKEHQVTNLAQAGISEYKIYKQLEHQDFNQYDVVIVSHTSPSRIHTRNHPLHKDGFHENCDLIITDLIEHFQPFNKNLQISKAWFQYHYDEEYQIDIYNLLRQQIKSIITIPYISLSHLKISNILSTEDHHIDFSDLWAVERGNINHYTEKGNRIIYETILNYLERSQL